MATVRDANYLEKSGQSPTQGSEAAKRIFGAVSQTPKTAFRDVSHDLGININGRSIMNEDKLNNTISDLVQKGQGILAADESVPTITKRLNAVGVQSTEENRRAYRSLLLTAPDIGKYLSGVILFEETLTQKTGDGMALPEVAAEQGIVPGIKVDKGKIPLQGAPGDMVTQGLDGLEARLQTYETLGARFAKWREVYPISEHNPTPLGIDTNAEVLARYAAVCQSVGFVPIFEPEVLLDVHHSIDLCADVTE